MRALLAKDSEFEVVGEAETARQAIEVVAARRPEVVVMDVALPDLSGVEATRQVLAHAPGVKVVALSVHADQQYVAGMLQAGASAYVLKEEAAVELLKAIRSALAGRTYLSPELASSWRIS